MSGIYIHIPFCHTKCGYCDFYSIGKRFYTDNFPELIAKEIKLRKAFLSDHTVETIYFGGGTPSILKPKHIEHIINAIQKEFNVIANPEITLEANPDDLTIETLKQISDVGVNRLSIGIQSFNDEELKTLGRRHNVNASINAIRSSQNVGFNNISIDLIYGIPKSTEKSWIENLQKAFTMGVQHLSCYHLTYEQGTPITRKVRIGKLSEVSEEISVLQYKLLRKLTAKAGFEHYEVSNFALPGYISKHNSAYWLGKEYLGVGPAAHSFNGKVREWNPPSLDTWASGIKSNQPATEQEVISKQIRFNELLVTNLRTKWGISIKNISKNIGKSYAQKLLNDSRPFLIDGKMLYIDEDVLLIPPQYYFISDAIVESLIVV